MRKSNHMHALEHAEPSAHYLEYIEGRTKGREKESKNVEVGVKAADVDGELFALQDKLSETIYGANFAQLVGGTESSLDVGKEKSQEAESPIQRSQPSAPETEVVMSRYASQDKIGPTIDSTAGVSNFK